MSNFDVSYGSTKFLPEHNTAIYTKKQAQQQQESPSIYTEKPVAKNEDNIMQQTPAAKRQAQVSAKPKLASQKAEAKPEKREQRYNKRLRRQRIY
ncbi:MAG: hypothetical protein MZV64_26825 [Ignavibacteriales bacterium]|nr:hypothetical protein [Ignavibacteriales bacterium]